MKVAYILNAFPGLYNSFTINEILGLIDKGVDVRGFALSASNLKTINENARRLAPNVQYVSDFWPASRWLARYSGAVRRKMGERVYRTLGQILVGARAGPGDRRAAQDWESLGWNRYALGRMADHLQKERFDLIHAGLGNLSATVAMALSDLTGIQFTFETHAFDLFVDFPDAKRKVEKAGKIFTISHYNKNYLIDRHACPPDKIAVMRVPINKAFCDRLPVTPRQDDLVVTACRLHPLKGLAYGIEAIKVLSGKHPTLRFMIMGDGLLKQELEAQAERLSLTGKVIFLGSRGNEEVLKLIARSTMFILPSVIAANGDRDGIPTSLIEAMYLRTPVVGSRVSGVPELIDDGVNGFLADPGDVSGLAEKMERLLSNKSLRQTMGENARIKVTGEFYRQSCEEILLAAWRKMIDGGNGSRVLRQHAAQAF